MCRSCSPVVQTSHNSCFLLTALDLDSAVFFVFATVLLGGGGGWC